MNSPVVFLFFLALRLLSVFLVRTWFVPDEYWQSLEVAHRLAFGYGHLTWEWTHGIRSYLHPVLISYVYQLLAVCQLDTVELLVLVPRVLQALLSAVADYRFYRWSLNSKWSLFLCASSWCWFYTGSRTLANTVESSLTTIALSLFPWYAEETLFLWPVSLLVWLRPTAALPWLVLCVEHLTFSKFTVRELLRKRYFVIGPVVAAACIALDSHYHGSFIVTPLQFVRFNVLHNIGTFYGTHNCVWYLTHGVPTLLGITLLPFLLATWTALRNPRLYHHTLVMLRAIGLTVAVLSALDHKEFRFLLVLLPMFLFITADFLARWSRHASRAAVWAVALALLVGNAVPAAYLSWQHQRATTAVMSHLVRLADAQPAGQPARVLFLMPCHSTPLYSHVHRNVTMRFLGCEPNFDAEVQEYSDEAEQYFRAPATWLRTHLPVHPPSALPTHVVLFDVAVDGAAEFLAKYEQVLELQHIDEWLPFRLATDKRVGEKVLVWQRKAELVRKAATKTPAKTQAGQEDVTATANDDRDEL